jgi:hypothetical protein
MDAWSRKQKKFYVRCIHHAASYPRWPGWGHVQRLRPLVVGLWHHPPGLQEYQLAHVANDIGVLGCSPVWCAWPTTPLMTSSLSMRNRAFMRRSHDTTLVWCTPSDLSYFLSQRIQTNIVGKKNHLPLLVQSNSWVWNHFYETISTDGKRPHL